MSEYFTSVAALACIYAISVSGFNLAAGVGGLVALSQAVLSGVGAYTSTLLAMERGLLFFPAALCGVAAAAGLAALSGFIFLRLGDDYFVIATLGLQLICWSVLNNWSEVTQGPMGIPGVPSPSIFGMGLTTGGQFSTLVAVLLLLVLAACRLLSVSPFGRVLRAIREDQVLVIAVGKNPSHFKVASLAFSGACAGLAGSLYAPFRGFIDPTSFTLAESVLVLSMVILGGAGSLWGPVLGAVILVALPEALRFLGVPAPTVGNLRQIVYGSFLVLMLVLRPRGLLGVHGFERRTSPL